MVTSVVKRFKSIMSYLLWTPRRGSKTGMCTLAGCSVVPMGYASCAKRIAIRESLLSNVRFENGERRVSLFKCPECGNVLNLVDEDLRREFVARGYCDECDPGPVPADLDGVGLSTDGLGSISGDD